MGWRNQKEDSHEIQGFGRYWQTGRKMWLVRKVNKLLNY